MILTLLLMASSSFSLTFAQSQPVSALQCTTTQAKSTVKFSFNSYRNTTGGWTSQVGLEHGGGPLGANTTAPWSVDIEHSTSITCDGDETISIIADLSVPSSLPPKRKVPADYELYPNFGYYKFHPDGVTWARAREICEGEGAHLVIINSESEALVMKQLFAKFPKNTIKTSSRNDFIAVGIVEQGSGNYRTVFGEPLSSTGFSRWSPGDPNDNGANDCIVLYESNLGLVDWVCTGTSPFVCEIEK